MPYPGPEQLLPGILGAGGCCFTPDYGAEPAGEPGRFIVCDQPASVIITCTHTPGRYPLCAEHVAWMRHHRSEAIATATAFTPDTAKVQANVRELRT